jgi:hypothetical protein
MRMLRSWLVVTALLVLSAALMPSAASADRPFTSRFAQMARGDVVIASNTVMTCPGSGAACTQGKAGTGGSLNNQDFNMTYVDVDGDASTFDSSTATLSLPAGTTVLFAGLYWGADTSAGGSGVAAPAPASRNAVKFKPPGGSYSNVTASTLDTDSVSATRYQGFADVTSQVQASGSGSYGVGNVQAGTGTDRYGGWSLVVAYRDPTLAVNWVSVYDGFGSTGFGGGNSSTDLVLTGFQTPASGTVSAEFGMVAYEGELGWTGETATLNGTTLTDAVHPAGNYFNSSITRLGSHVTTKSPNYVNQLGYDKSMLNVDGYLPAGSTSATVHLASSLDMFIPGVMTLVTDQVAVAPSVVTPPAISGTVQDGQTLSAGNGTWDGTNPITYTYQWQSCDSSGNNCSNIAGATASTYQLVPADIGKTFRVVVTATNAADAASSTSAATTVVTPAPPANTAPPLVSGTLRDGQTLTATSGSWTGTAPISYTYQWQRCDAGGANCQNVGGATANTYTLTPSDVASTMKVVVTATNAAASVPATSAATAAVAAEPPANSSAPTVSGTARDGQTLSASTGTWTGTPTVTHSYQWRRCNTSGASCVDIAGATASSYLQTPADIGSTIRVVVTGTNAGGSTPATSAQTGVVTAIPPASTVAPTIAGTARDGQTLTAANGTWSGSPTIAFTYQWRRCDAAGANCSNIVSATASTYGLTPSDVGKTIRVVVTGTNAGGSANGTSAQTASVAADPPAATTGPVVTGTYQDGQTLTTSNGTWTGTPTITFAYGWRRCDTAGINCTTVGGTGPTYTLVSADVGKTIRSVVTGTNAGGSFGVNSAPTPVIAALPPANTALPTVTGTAQDSRTLVGAHGSWTGSLPMSFSHRWQRCDSAGNNCSNIAGATNSTYVLAPADIGSRVRFVVTASNAAGSLEKSSNATVVVTALPPSNVVLPALSGTTEDGGALTATNGSWTGSPTITFARQWQRCDSAGANCSNIGGATGTTYSETAADVGKRLRVVVTATNAGASVPATSAVSAVVAATPPVNTAPPTVSGTVVDGQTLTASTGAWTGTPTIAYAYQWRRCAATGNSCVDVPGATGSTYLLTPTDVGSTMRVNVAATNAGGSGVATSEATGSVGAIPPHSTGAPAISGTAADGQTLTVSSGDWTGTPTITFTYQWRRCDGDGSNCADIAGATGTSYQLTSADVGARIRAEVTAVNAGGDATVTTQSTDLVTSSPPAATSDGPSISGPAQQGQTLTAETGTWTGTGPITYTYQWQRCDENGQNCVAIPGATGPTYTPTADDVGRTIVVVVTGTNTDGSSSSQSSPTPVVGVPSPANTVRPTVSGELTTGGTLTAGHGTWTGPGPVTYEYQWLRCDAEGHDCVEIDGATGETYTLTGEDEGHSIRVEVTAKNPGGTTTRTSEDTVPVAAAEDEDLGETIPGSLVSASRCQRVLAGTGFKQQRMSGVGKIRVRVKAGAYIAPKKPLRIVAEAPAKKIRSVIYLIDNRPVLRPRKAPYLLKVTPKLFARTGKHKVAFKVTPRKGRPHRMTLKITTAPCENVLSGSQWKTDTGTGLRLRIDSRKAMQSASFNVPKKMLPSVRDAGKRAIGLVQLYLAKGGKKRFELRLRKGSTTLLKASAGAPKIVLTKTGAVVTALPKKVGVLELTLFTRDKTSPKALLHKRQKAKVAATTLVAGRSVRLKTIIRAQRH